MEDTSQKILLKMGSHWQVVDVRFYFRIHCQIFSSALSMEGTW